MKMNMHSARIEPRNHHGRKGFSFMGRRIAAGLLIAVLSAIALTGCGTEPVEPTPVQNTPTSIATTEAAPVTNTPMPTPTATQAAVSAEWEEQVSRIVWAAYSPPTADPEEGIEATTEAIGQDLITLRKAGFTGLVTYSSSGVLGHELPVLAEAFGFEGLIMGIWDPTNQEEIAAAEVAARSPIVLGFCVGNEGLHKRYEMSELSVAIESLREATGKPCTTTEEIDDYTDKDLLQLGDWVFPNVHPYFHNQLDPDAAVDWTVEAYRDFKRRTDRFIIFKEVGLPTAGDPGGILSEAAQKRYYLELAKTDVQFVYFEGFDQPWKTHLPIEPHWGIFRSDQSPKLLGLHLMGLEPTPSHTPEPSPTPEATITPTPEPSPTPQPTATPAPKATPTPEPPPTPKPTTPPISEAFYIYHDADSPHNHYKPTGYMGDTGDIHIDEASRDRPHSGSSCIRIVYDAEGKGPNECPYPGPCGWAGVYWQEPPNNWGRDPERQGRGFDLSDYSRLVFWARAERPTAIEFKVGGINEPYGDSLIYPRAILAELTQDWQEFEIDLASADLTHIIGGFLWVTNQDRNPDGITFYLDEIRFERK